MDRRAGERQGSVRNTERARSIKVRVTLTANRIIYELEKYLSTEVKDDW